MKHTRLFQSNRSQAVRLPKAVAFPDDVTDVDIVALGRARLVVPADAGWDVWFDGPVASDDFMSTRDQPAEQARETL